jgi:hypothetical protein
LTGPEIAGPEIAGPGAVMVGLEVALVDLQIVDLQTFIPDLPVYAAGSNEQPDLPNRRVSGDGLELLRWRSLDTTLLNTAALCLNCHRECYHGENTAKLRVELKPLETSDFFS